MENLQTAWHYVGSLWDIATPFLILFLGIWIGIKIGKKWGKEDAEQWLKAKIGNAIMARLGYPLNYLNAPERDDKKGARIQGILDVNFPGPADKETGFPIKFKFTPDKTQWKPGPCCLPHKKPELPT